MLARGPAQDLPCQAGEPMQMVDVVRPAAFPQRSDDSVLT